MTTSVDRAKQYCDVSSKLKWQYAIAEQLSLLFNCQVRTQQFYDNIESPKYPKHGQFALPVQRIRHLLLKSEPWCSQTCAETAQWIVDKLSPSDHIEKATAIGSFVNFAVPRPQYTENVLQQIIDDPTFYGFAASSAPLTVITCDLPRVPHLLDPNHFRGLVLGTFAQRSLLKQNSPVQLINTLSTWNIEFGYLALAFKRNESLIDAQQVSLVLLNQLYKKIKLDMLLDQSIDEQAQQLLLELEQGHSDTIQLWKRLQAVIIRLYDDLLSRRLPILFDDTVCGTPWEDLEHFYNLLEKSGKLIKTEEGEWKVDLEIAGLGTPLLRDKKGISTQVTQDIIQLIKLRQKVDDVAFIHFHIAGQHLSQRIQQVHYIYYEILNPNLQPSIHLSFGKVRNDTVSGFGIVDCLDALQQTMIEIMEENEGTEKYDSMMAQLGQLSITTRNKMVNDRELSVQRLAEGHADKLGVCTLFVRQLAQRRGKPMTFSASAPPEVFGNSGVFLQYVHSRLCGIERQLVQRGLLVVDAGQLIIRPTISTKGMGLLLFQKEAFDVIETLALFPHVVQQAQLAMDPSGLVTYLFKMARVANQALYCLRIKDVQKDLALARWSLFWAAKQIIANGLDVLGIEPVTRM